MIGKKTIGAILVLMLAYGYNAYKNRKEKGPVIETSNGKLQGVISESRGGREFYEFLGVPYAKPPVAPDLRFEPPQPAENWEGIRDASNYGPECAQLRLITGTYGGEEDCLYLNVFVPKEKKQPLPVMVFLHGGAFVTGSSNGYRPKYFMDEDVIFVTVNYRLAALGFYNTGDGVVRGNMGLKDQIMALKWVQQNIKAFGGDPTQVTLFGESAGSSSTSFHILSPLSKGLFSKAIMQSGVSTSNWSTYKDPAKQAKRFATKFGCTTDDSKEMVKCLKNVDTKTFVYEHKEVLQPLRDQITLFAPTVETIKDENSFLIDDPLKVLKSGKINKVPVIIGVNSDEGLLSSSIITANQTKLDEANSDFEFWASRALNYPRDREDVSKKIRKFYFGDVTNIASPDLIRNYTNLYSDRQFFIPVNNFIRNYANDVPIRLYYWVYEGQFTLSRLLASTQKPYLPVLANVLVDMAYYWVRSNVLGMENPHPGVCHADDLPFFYNWPLSPEIKSDSKDFLISKDIVSTWASFAKNSKQVEFRGVEWKPVKPSDAKLMYLKIDSTPELIPEPFEDRVKFWKTIDV